MTEQSKTCGEPRRTIENTKWLGDFSKSAAESGQSDSVKYDKSDEDEHA